MASMKKDFIRIKTGAVGSGEQQTKNERDAISSYMLMDKSANRIAPTFIFDPKVERFSDVE